MSDHCPKKATLQVKYIMATAYRMSSITIYSQPRRLGHCEPCYGKLVIPRARTVRDGPRSGPYLVPRVGWSRAPKARSGRVRARTQLPWRATSARASRTMPILCIYSPTNFEPEICEFARASRRLTPPHRRDMGVYYTTICEAEDEVDGIYVLEHCLNLLVNVRRLQEI